jgi:acetoin utilization deacetylase AcuC-like enzyme
VIVVYDELYLAHLRNVSHPESPARVAAVAAHLEACGLMNERVAARDATDAELLLVHAPEYLERVKRDVAQARPQGGYLSTGDTAIDDTSLAVARRAAGGALAALEQAVTNDSAAFALIRPPGHHAEPSRGMGFCLFDSAAVAAHAFVHRHGGRALIVDFDYHHGNGSQAAARDGVSFVSSHAFPAYPGTGGSSENALRKNSAVVNVPLRPHGFGTESFVALWQRLLPEVAALVRPDLLVVSAGYDYASGDPIGDLGVDGPLAAAELANVIRETADTYARGRTVYCLEGGYDPQTLARSVEATLRAHDRGTSGVRAEPGSLPAAQRAVLEQVAAWSN